MENFINPTTGESDIGSNECIEQYFPLVYTYARRAFPLNIGPFDSDDLAQEACVKLWLIARKHIIQSPKTYIRRVVQSVKVDMLRKYKTQTYQALPVDEDGELQARDIESEWQWPEDRVDHQRLQASYAHARRNIASHMHVEGANGPRSHETQHRY